MRKPSCENMRHRLLEACEIGDVEILRDAAQNGLVFFSAMLDRAAVRGHIPCMDVITDQKHVCVSGLAVEHLARHRHPDILRHLAERNAISMSGILNLCDLACEER